MNSSFIDVNALISAWRSDIATWFTVIIVLLMVILFLRHFRNDKTAPTALTMLATLGLLGTFIGVFIGLLGFDTTDIHGSIPQLLEGLKVAFFSSIAGLVLSMLLRYRMLWQVRSQNLPERADPMEQSLWRLEAALCGKDAAIPAALEMLHCDIQETNKTLTRFTSSMAESSAEAIKNMVEEVIQKFSTGISDQLGGTFKQFNQGVGQLITWQEQYKNDLEAMQAQYGRSITAIEGCRSAMAEIAEKSGDVLRSTNAMGDLLRALDTMRQTLEGDLTAFKETAAQTRKAIPEINESFRLLAQHLYKMLGEVIQKTSELVTRHQDLSQRSEEVFNTLQTRLSDVFAAMEKESGKLLNTNLKALEEQSAFTNQTVRRNSTYLESVFHELFEMQKRQLAEFDDNLKQELSNCLTALGSQLASLSNKFVEDYAPLTDRLREVVRIAEGLNDGQ